MLGWFAQQCVPEESHPRSACTCMHVGTVSWLGCTGPPFHTARWAWGPVLLAMPCTKLLQATSSAAVLHHASQPGLCGGGGVVDIPVSSPSTYTQTELQSQWNTNEGPRARAGFMAAPVLSAATSNTSHLSPLCPIFTRLDWITPSELCSECPKAVVKHKAAVMHPNGWTRTQSKQAVPAAVQ